MFDWARNGILLDSLTVLFEFSLNSAKSATLITLFDTFSVLLRAAGSNNQLETDIAEAG